MLPGVRKLGAGHWSFPRKWPKINSKRHTIIETIPFISKVMILITSCWTSNLCWFLTVVVQCVALCKCTLRGSLDGFSVKLLYYILLLFMPNLSVTSPLNCALNSSDCQLSGLWFFVWQELYCQAPVHMISKTSQTSLSFVSVFPEMKKQNKTRQAITHFHFYFSFCVWHSWFLFVLAFKLKLTRPVKK